MDMPTKMRIGYRDYAVEVWPPNVACAARKYGECDSANSVIRIDTCYGPAVTAETLLHEVLHACYESGNIDGEDDEERTVSAMSKQLAQVWRDNPDFVAFMSEALG